MAYRAVQRLGRPSLARQLLPRPSPTSSCCSYLRYGGRSTVPSGARCISTKRSFYTANRDELADDTYSDSVFRALDTFPRRHIGPNSKTTYQMLETVGTKSLDGFVKSVVPQSVLEERNLKIEPRDGFSESELVIRLREIASQNALLKSYIGAGYYGTKTPEVIKRNILECPEWYTSYTPYQPEISQGRLESLLNFQTMVTSLTALDIANASVLDELTAAAEAMTLSLSCLPTARQKRPNKSFVVSHLLHPQTIAGLACRAEGFGINVVVKDLSEPNPVKEFGDDLIGVLVQYPDTMGQIVDFEGLAKQVHDMGGIVSCATDLLALTLLKPPGEWGADIAFGNAQRFGVPMGYGGPHAGFFATSEKYKRKLPGRLIGVSIDKSGDKAYRLALQTREQHIRREKATSNICTAQALLANMSAMYAVYHGPDGLQRIAHKVLAMKAILAEGLRNVGYGDGVKEGAFDTIVIETENAQELIRRAEKEFGINFRNIDETHIGISVDETVGIRNLMSILQALAPPAATESISRESMEDMALKMELDSQKHAPIEEKFMRTSKFLEHAVFNSYHSETEMLRYIHHLQSKDLSLAHSMIPLGSCTMKLNASTEMLPVTLPEFSSLHPFIPISQAEGYATLIKELESDLAEITGFDAVSLQPNSGAQGEFTGLRVIREYFKSIGQEKRDIILIPVSAHGTNPASATMSGCRVVSIKCDHKTGNLDIDDLKEKAKKHADSLAGIMITYPSTFGVFEPEVKTVCQIVHEHGGQVYMDGANMNAQIGLTSPGAIGADVCHLNLHKTFCIPHGGGGPGVGPICVKSHLSPFLPSHPFVATGGGAKTGIPPVAAAPWGSASILPISWAYIKMMGARGLTHATKITLLNANYMAKRLEPHFEILYTNEAGRCAHEFILDVRPFKESAGIEAIDIAKRLMDYSFHAPTMSWPVTGTLMIEPTESESKEELDRFCDALIEIRKEIKEIEEGKQDKSNNVLKNAPHPLKELIVGEDVWGGEWGRKYGRERAAWPLPWLRERKFWPSIGRIDDAYGDTHLFCTCEPVETIE